MLSSSQRALLSLSPPSAKAASQILLTLLENLEKVILPSIKSFLLSEIPKGFVWFPFVVLQGICVISLENYDVFRGSLV